ncbi:hypothetical protein NR798_13935 [Archangium gephyra]|uniref:hypothetical protein n=1 Tax=Archangium gephyra TaxID=48 RepID=UPI0035D506D0
MPSLQDVQLELTGWTRVQQSHTESHWRNDVGDVLSLLYFGLPPDIPAPLEQLSPLRAGYRSIISKAGGGIVEVETQPLAGLRAVRSIFKLPQQPFGMTYVASLTLPFADCSFVLKVQCAEHGMTGLRDNTVFAQAMSRVMPTLNGDPQRWIDEHWFQDPYDPADRSPVMRNLSEDPSYDAQFPDHPLSRARSYLPLLERSFRISPALRQIRPFTGPSRTPVRDHHYTFAYRALPLLFLSHPEGFFGGLEQAGEDYLKQGWKIVGDRMPQGAVLEPEGMALDFLGNDHAVLAVVRLPPARADAEAVMVGCYLWKAPPRDAITTPRARYFTLALAGQEAGAPRTVFCEWRQENGQLSSVSNGDGPNTVEGFVAAIQHKVSSPA